MREPQDPPEESQSPSQDTSSSVSGLTYQQQLKQDAMLWAEFLYSEYRRNQALREEQQNESLKPTYHHKDSN